MQLQALLEMLVNNRNVHRSLCIEMSINKKWALGFKSKEQQLGRTLVPVSF